MQQNFTQDTRAAMWMTASVFLGSWFPLVVAVIGPDINPLLFQFWHGLVLAFVLCVYLLLVRATLALTKDNWLSVCRQLTTRDGVRSVLPVFGTPLFVWATWFVDTALVTVLTSGWLIVFVAYRQNQDQHKRYTSLTCRDWYLLAVAMAGMGLAALAQSSGEQRGPANLEIVAGVGLCALVIVAASSMAHRFVLADTLLTARSLKGTSARQSDRTRGELDALVCVSIVAHIAGAVVCGLLALLLTPVVEIGPVFGYPIAITLVGIAAIGALNALGDISWGYANLATSNLGVNALRYLAPALSLLWLALFATVDVYRSDWLVVGAVAVIAANTLINSQPETRYGNGSPPA